MCPAHSVTLYRGRLDPILEISEEHSLVTLIESETAPLWVWSPPTSVMTNQSVSFHSPFKSLEMAETHLWIEVGSWRPPLAVRPIASWFPWHVFRQQSSREWPSSTLTSPPPPTQSNRLQAPACNLVAVSPTTKFTHRQKGWPPCAWATAYVRTQTAFLRIGHAGKPPRSTARICQFEASSSAASHAPSALYKVKKAAVLFHQCVRVDETRTQTELHVVSARPITFLPKRCCANIAVGKKAEKKKMWGWIIIS